MYKNNMYYMDSVPQEYKVPAGNTAQQVTTTGQEGVIFHGVPDWVYEGMCRLTIYSFQFIQHRAIDLLHRMSHSPKAHSLRPKEANHWTIAALGTSKHVHVTLASL